MPRPLFPRRRALLAWLTGLSAAGPAAAQFADDEDDAPRRGRGTAAPLPAGTVVERDLAFGPQPQQKLDVYRPPNARGAPIVLMVHGGAWMIGDKGNPGVAPNKVARWVPRGWIVVSANYRMDRTAPDPLAQADDVGLALAFVQQRAASWGGDPARVLLMGHSAGAHLVSLVTADPSIAERQGARPWLGTVSLDSAAYDLVQIMETRHFRFYDKVFGPRRENWVSNSPYHRLRGKPRPMLLVCSSRRSDSCPQAERFAGKLREAGGRVELLRVEKDHGTINGELGRGGEYTERVEAFLRELGLG